MQQLSEDTQRWLDSQPKKPIVAKVVFSSAADTILALEPTYKSTWNLPGGVVEAREDPVDAACREVFEELGLVIGTDSLDLAGTIYNTKDDVLCVVYSYKSILDENAKLKLQVEEVRSYAFITPEVAITKMADYYRPFWESYQLRISAA